MAVFFYDLVPIFFSVLRISQRSQAVQILSAMFRCTSPDTIRLKDFVNET